MHEIMEGQATSCQIGAYLMGLRVKGETVDEIAGSARAMREKATRIRAADPLVIDTCGTGGDRANTFNISTTAAFVVAGGGMTVAKHGNRAVSSKSGSADVLTALGVKIDLPAHHIADCVNEVGIGFLFAPLFHGAMKHCAEPRKELGTRTLLNILGPLTNPAGATIQVLGVFDAGLTDLLAQVLVRLGTQHCFVVHGMDGLDEVTLTDRTRVSEGKRGVVSSYEIDPSDFGLQRVRMRDLTGGTAGENARITRDVLLGRKDARRDIVCMNAALAFTAAGKTATIQEGYTLAGSAIDNGAAYEKLERLIAFTNKG
jgi:anthranilate phosphoribosyltransferase